MFATNHERSCFAGAWPPVLACACAVAIGLAAASSRSASAASSSSTVGATVLSSTYLDTAACPPTSLGLLTVSTSAISSPCSVTFGSSNSTSTLRAFQRDRHDRAMTREGTTWTVRSGAGSFRKGTISATRAWVIGLHYSGANLLMRTTDDGDTWTPQTPCAANQLRDIHAFNDNVVVTMGNTPCRTTDGGATWTPISNPAGTTWVEVSGDLGASWAWARNSAGLIWRTTDDGANWSNVDLPVTDATGAIFGVSATEAYAMTNYDVGGTQRQNVLWRTTDSGATWVPTTPPTLLFAVGPNQSGTLNMLGRSATGTLVGAGGNGHWRSADGGTTWTLTNSAARLGLEYVGVDGSTNERWVSSYRNSSMRMSSNDGVTFVAPSVPSDTVYHMYGFSNARAGLVFALGNGETIYRSTDHGSTWTSVSTSRPIMRAATSFSDQTFITAGTMGSIFRSTDGGATLTTPSSSTTEQLNGVARVDRDTAVIVGHGGTVRRSSDRGATWDVVTSGTTQHLYDVDVADGVGVAFAAGAAGTLLRSVDGGQTWSALASGTGLDLVDVAVGADGSDIFVATTTAGQLRHSPDGGATWFVRTTGGDGPIVDFDVSSAGVLVASEVVTAPDPDEYRLIRSTDDGATWSSSIANSTSERNEVEFVDRDRLVYSTASNLNVSEDAGVTARLLGNAGNGNVVNAVAAVGPAAYVVAGDRSMVSTMAPSSSVPDFGDAGADFDSVGGAFGACLESSSGVSAVTWFEAGACQLADDGDWTPLVADPASGGAVVASSPLGVANAQVDLRFGFRPANSSPPGLYLAGVDFEVVAP